MRYKASRRHAARRAIVMVAALGIVWTESYAQDSQKHFVPRVVLGPEKAATLIGEIFRLGVVVPISPFLDRGEELKEFWKGNAPEYQGALREVALRFVLTGDDSTAAQVSASQPPLRRPKNFDVFIVFDGSAITVRTTDVLEARLRGGVRFSMDKKSKNTSFVDGASRSGIVIAVGAEMEVKQTTKGNARGVAICPRELELPKIKGFKAQLVSTPYALSAVRYRFEGKVRGQLLGGREPGKARAVVLTTENIPPAPLPADEVYQRNPRAETKYQPLDLPQFVAFDPGGSLEGIKVVLDLQNAAGYRRKSILERVGYVAVVDAPPHAYATTRSVDVGVSVGLCALVYTQEFRWTEYTREKFVTPDETHPRTP